MRIFEDTSQIKIYKQHEYKLFKHVFCFILLYQYFSSKNIDFFIHKFARTLK